MHMAQKKAPAKLTNSVIAKFFPGIPPDIMSITRSMLQEIIKGNRQLKYQEASAVGRYVDGNIRGGFPGPHIHVNDKVYLVSDAQWNTISKNIISTARAKLASAKAIDFTQAAGIADATQAIG
jgi:hypothetical protein